MAQPEPGQAPQSVRFELRLGDAELADELEQRLVDVGASAIHRREEYGLLPLLPIVLGAVVALSALSTLVMWIRAKTGCRSIIDVRGGTIAQQVDCKVRDGRIIVVTEGDTKVEIVDVPEVLNMSDVLSAALSSGAEAVKAVAERAGAQVEVPG
jgi:hypothetical protein